MSVVHWTENGVPKLVLSGTVRSAPQSTGGRQHESEDSEGVVRENFVAKECRFFFFFFFFSVCLGVIMPNVARHVCFSNAGFGGVGGYFVNRQGLQFPAH